jgi:tRNA-dihydrouridine synthase B
MILDFSKKVYALAPLAGWTDLPFRETVKKFGADLTVSEMISSNALVYNASRTKKMIEKSPLEIPFSVQLAGSNAEIIRQAVEILNEEEGIDIIDLNAGCPAPKIVNHGSGSSLLKDLGLLKSIITAIKTTSNKPMTSVKIRLGFDKKIGEDIARVVEDAGADFLVVHGRTKVGAYKAVVDYDQIARIKESVSIPVIANGDITSYEIAHRVMEHTKADGVMIGRGSMGNPWIFRQLKEGKALLTHEEKRDVVLEHFDNMIKFHGEYGAILFRKHIHNYSKGYEEASAFRFEINRIDDAVDARRMIETFFK